jgi:hypothetical protein
LSPGWRPKSPRSRRREQRVRPRVAVQGLDDGLERGIGHFEEVRLEAEVGDERDSVPDRHDDVDAESALMEPAVGEDESRPPLSISSKRSAIRLVVSRLVL